MKLATQFDAAVLARYDVTGPRYTSYPTAPQFKTEFGEAEYREHARLSNDDPIPRPLSLYLHVPFCASPCFYCGCNRVITRDRARGEAYLARLTREVAMQGALFDRDRRVIQIHLGGGTPNFFDLEQLGHLLDSLGANFNLARGDDREFGIEIDPRCADEAYVHGLARMGFNRVSFGVQDFDPDVQEAINRVQPREQTLSVLTAARAAGMRSVSVDLIYGLPRQTAERFAATLDTTIALRPDRIALYSYAHLPELFKAQRQIVAAELPAPGEKLALLGLAVETLLAAGYEYIGMDHFALPDDDLVRAREHHSLQRNFQGYSTHAECDLVGMGASAIGRVRDCYAQNARELPQWDSAIDAGRLPVVKGLVLGDEDLLRQDIIQSLMCYDEVDIALIERRHGVCFATHFATELKRLEALARDGLVEVDAQRIRITPRGRLLMRMVAMAFDAYLARPQETVRRFSRVI
jgi:oxygen-independent coproporphyrinogen-3 oxidase